MRQAGTFQTSQRLRGGEALLCVALIRRKAVNGPDIRVLSTPTHFMHRARLVATVSTCKQPVHCCLDTDHESTPAVWLHLTAAEMRMALLVRPPDSLLASSSVFQTTNQEPGQPEQAMLRNGTGSCILMCELSSPKEAL